ncbi:MAG TPA: hypothetical protein PKC43_07085 [Phycisphaerales bacterium]|nr:hypothetical protein [Phycisphaerales bacterium]HMP37198.1 hypothetical protein [Phycisphaerales bacterium]
MISKKLLSLSAIAIATSMVSLASADTTVVPNVTMTISSTLGGTTTFNPANYGSTWQSGYSTFGFAGNNSSAGNWGLGWSMLVNPDPFIVANLAVTNTSMMTQTFTITVQSPIDTTNFPFICIGGSVVGSITDGNGDGATLTSPVGGSLYSAFVDNNVVGTLLNDPFSVSAGNYLSAGVGPATFGAPIPSLFVPTQATTNFGITLTFTLTAGDSASFTSIFVVEGCIPGPASLALLAFAGMAGSRRRRS